MSRFDNKLLKKLEKKLRIKNSKNGALPASFQRDNLDYVLNYMDDAQSARNVFERSNIKDTGVDKARKRNKLSKSSSLSDTRSNSNLCSYGDDLLSISNADMMSDEDNDDNDNHLSSKQVTDDEDDSDYRKVQNYSHRQTINLKDGFASNKVINKVTLECKYVKNGTKTNKDLKKERFKDLKEDIYGRLRDSKGNVVTSGVYQPPAKQKKNMEESSEDQTINKQIHSILNRFTETTMTHYIKELVTLFGSHSRAVVSESLSNAILNSTLIHTSLPMSSLSNFAFLISVLHSLVGVEVSSAFLQLLTTSLLKLLDVDITENANTTETKEDNNEEYDDVKSRKIRNALTIFVKLYSFKVIESSIILEFIDHLLRFSFIDIISLDFMFKEIGFDIRKDDVVSFKELYSKMIEKGEKVESEGGKKMIIYKNMLDTLRVIKNNQKHKMAEYDEEMNIRKIKDLKVLTKGNQAPAIHVTLKDLALSDEMGKWWLVGSAWAGRLNEDNKNLPILKNNEHDLTLKGFELKLLKKAQVHRMNTTVKKMIFCTIMTSTNYRDAFERLLRLNLTSEQQRDILRVILNLVIKETPYNQFYVLLAGQFCAYHRKYLMACKFSIWDQLKTLTSLTEKHLTNFSIYFLHLIIKRSLQLPVLKVIEFAEIEKSTVIFLKTFLMGYFSSPEINWETIATTFTYIASNAKLARFKSGLVLFMRQFIVKDMAVLRNEVIEKIKKASRLLEAHSTSDILPSNWTSLD